jgi:hypothetical protein
MKHFLLGFSLFIATITIGQIPDYGVLTTNFTITDVDGEEYDVFEILDAGTPIVLDLFAEWCGPCWNYHKSGELTGLYADYGPDGTNEVMVIAVETDASTPLADMYGGAGTNNWDWFEGINYPIANQNIGGIFNQTYYPTIVMICPDRTVTEIGQQSKANIYSAIGTCGAAPTEVDDPRLTSSLSDDFFCQGASAKVIALLQNFGSETLTEAAIEIVENGNVIETYNWTGSLDQFEVEEVEVGTVTPTETTTYTIRIATANDDTDNDEIEALIAPAPVLEVGQEFMGVTFDLVIDDYASELGVVFNEGAPPAWGFNTIHNNASNSPSNYLGVLSVGTLTDGQNSWTQVFPVENEGCHYALFLDSFGDGIALGAPNAKAEIIGSGGSKVTVNPDYGDGVITVFDISFVNDASVENLSWINQMNVYPIPASETTTLAVDFKDNMDAKVVVMNLQGQVVMEKSITGTAGKQTIDLDVSGLESGMYTLVLSSTQGQVTTALSVVK